MESDNRMIIDGDVLSATDGKHLISIHLIECFLKWLGFVRKVISLREITASTFT